MDVDLLNRDRSRLDLVGLFVEVQWSPDHPHAEYKCDHCVYLVRGREGDMVCLELVYDAPRGVHHKDAVYWVAIGKIEYMRVLTEMEARVRMERLEHLALSEVPRD